METIEKKLEQWVSEIQNILRIELTLPQRNNIEDLLQDVYFDGQSSDESSLDDIDNDE